MRGDRPPHHWQRYACDRFTPHARGSTQYAWFTPLIPHVYPACAGIDPKPDPVFFGDNGLPRMRGDRP